MGLTPNQKARRRNKAIEALREQVKTIGGDLQHRGGGIVDFTGPLGGVIRLSFQSARWHVVDDPRDNGVGLEPMFWRLADLPPLLRAPGLVGKVDLTLFADASVCTKTGTAGWGAWWKTSAMSQGESCGGPLGALGMDSDEAESQALANALSVAAVRGYIPRGAVIMLQSDSLAALTAVRRRARAFNRPAQGGHGVGTGSRQLAKPNIIAAVDLIRAIAERNEAALLVRHVKGHTNGDGRFWVNRLCDKLAKEGMNQRRRELAEQKESTDA